MSFRLNNTLFRSVLGLWNLRPGIWCAQHRWYFGKSELKHDLRSYIENVDKHLFDFGAVEAFSAKTDDIEIYAQSESFSSHDAGWKFRWYRDSTSTRDRLIVSYLWLFEKGFQAIRIYVSGESLSPSQNAAFSALERFYMNKENYERCLRLGLDRTSSETGVAGVLAQHLLSQLIPHPANYFLDCTSKGKPDFCPCGCGRLLHFGITHIGSPILFHGYADVIISPGDKQVFEKLENSDENSSAVFTIKSFKDWNTAITGSDTEDDIFVGEFRRHGMALRDRNAVCQLCKQAIAISLCKRNKMYKNLRNYEGQPAIIPVCAVTDDAYEIALYDAENDFLLRCLQPRFLFDDEMMNLPISSVIDLWFVINHGLFCRRQTDDTVNVLKGTCNLHPQLGDDLLQSVVTSSTLMFKPDYTTQTSYDLPDGGAKRADERSHIWRQLKQYTDFQNSNKEEIKIVKHKK